MFFFFKQKTAYEMRISDWSSDVCSSDLLGVGLIWRIMPPDVRLYDRLLGVDEVRSRIERCWKPYHRAVATALDETHRRFGKVWHVNCHSMPARGNAASEAGPVARADFVLGDRAAPPERKRGGQGNRVD